MSTDSLSIPRLRTAPPSSAMSLLGSSVSSSSGAQHGGAIFSSCSLSRRTSFTSISTEYSHAAKSNITLVPFEEVLAVAKSDREVVSTTRKFFDLFIYRTKGCRMSCELEQDVPVSHAWERSCRARARALAWFPFRKLVRSAELGCAYCAAIRFMFEKTFSTDSHRQYEYRFCYDSGIELMRQRISEGCSESMPVERIELYALRGSRVQLKGIQMSSPLNGKNLSLARLRGWMDACRTSHEDCILAAKYRGCCENSRPCRLIDVSILRQSGQIGVRLVTTEPGQTYDYACLSHRWDNHTKEAQTTADNLASRLDFMNIESLPINIRQALDLCRQVNIPYLWVDSLCIVQAGDEGLELANELTKMGLIYQNGQFTIAVVAARNSSEGCYSHDQWSDICFRITGTDIGEDVYMGARMRDWRRGAQIQPSVRVPNHLFHRAWVFQERLLSRRMLLCNHGEFEFECLHRRTCECGAQSMSPHPSSQAEQNLLWLDALTATQKLAFKGLRHETWVNSLARDSSILGGWPQIVSAYMLLRLSNPADVLPALGRCAQELNAHVKDIYVAGMWKSRLALDLLWYVDVPAKRLDFARSREKASTAPSWSWASLPIGQIIRQTGASAELNEHETKVQAGWRLRKDPLLLKDAIKSIVHEPELPTNLFGRLMPGAHIRLDTTLYKWYLRLYCERNRFDHRSAHTFAPRLWRINTPEDHKLRLMTCVSAQAPLSIGDSLQYEVHLDESVESAVFSKRQLSLERCSYKHRRSPCSLIEIQLLHARRQVLTKFEDQFYDTFIMLVRRRSKDRRDCFRRIGLLNVKSHSSPSGSWLDFMRTRMDIREGEFSIY